MGLSNHQRRISKFFPKQPIAYQPGLSLVFNSVNAGILLSQLLYWHGKGRDRDGWTYKTIDEMKAETGLTRYQQETAIRTCVEAGILDYKLAGIPAKRHFKINLNELENQLPSLKKAVGIAYFNPTTQIAEKQQTNTKSTTKTNTKNIKFGYVVDSGKTRRELLEAEYSSTRKSTDSDL